MMSAHVLELPRLGPPRDCPRTWTLHGNSPAMARMGLALLDIGVLDKGIPAANPVELVRQSLSAWLAHQHRDMNVFRFELEISEFDLYKIDEDARPYQVNVALSPAGAWPLYHIGPRVKELERRHPGLGQTVMHWIERAGARSIPLYTPAEALSLCSWNYWQGMNDEREAIAEAVANGESADDIEILTRAEFDADIPAWAHSPKRKLRTPALKQLAAHQPGRHTARIAALLIQIETLLCAKNTRHCALADRDNDNTCVHRAAWLRWSRNDPMQRILDDWHQDISMMGEWTENFAEIQIRFGATTSDDILADIWREFLDRIACAMDILRLVDKLIMLIGVPDHG